MATVRRNLIISKIERLKELNNFYKPNILFHFAQDMYYYYFNVKETSGKLLSHSGEFDGVEDKDKFSHLIREKE